jgi:signal transduction histidine kinase
MEQTKAELAALATHLRARRRAILEAWRRAAQCDPTLTAIPVLSRSQFNDHIPEVLDAFERRLSAENLDRTVEAAEEQKAGAAGHGLHRWQLGYRQREVMYEWRHLHLCLVDELERYAASHANLQPSVMPGARRALAELCSEGVCESASQYARLRQTEAAGRVRDLEQAIQQLQDLDQSRLAVFREAAHDLRGNVGIVKNAATVLRSKDLPEHMRDRSIVMLEKGVTSLVVLLNDLLDLSRLEAGRDERRVAAFDVTEVLGELCASMQPLAADRALFLESHGPTALQVEGDAVKTRRIAQNLLLNAIKYTEQGGVRVSWEEVKAGELERWVLSVQDTGPGFADGPVTPIAHALKEATDEAKTVQEKVESSTPSSTNGASARPLTSQSNHRSTDENPGEGIGLSIVKRLCELLDASLELETGRGKGTVFRVVFPRRYDAA